MHYTSISDESEIMHQANEEHCYNPDRTIESESEDESICSSVGEEDVDLLPFV